MARMTVWLALGGAVLLACAETAAPVAEVHRALAPTYVSDGGQVDGADYACQVVLRQVGRVSTGSGYATTCDLGLSEGGVCLYVWEGVIDVAEGADAQAVELLFRTSDSAGAWYRVPAQPAGPASGGFVPYSFRVAHFTPAAGMSMTSLNRTEIDLFPYLLTSQGVRLFDHNRVAHPLGHYELRLANLWTVAADSACAPDPEPAPLPELVFDYPAFDEVIHGGPLVAGGALRVAYDGRRLRETQACLGAQGPVSATTLWMGWRVDGGAEQQAQVEAYRESYGYACAGQEPPCVTVETMEPTIELPLGARELELWFWCVPGFSQGARDNWKYDSDYGRNYRFPVAEAGDTLDWAGGWQLHNARSGESFDLPEPLTWSGFTNMGKAVEARAYHAGVTDRPQGSEGALWAWVESDLGACLPGAEPVREPLWPAAEHTGPYASDTLYRWAIEPALMRCPKGTYRYRFLFSLDGGHSVRALGLAASTDDPASADTWRTLISL